MATNGAVPDTNAMNALIDVLPGVPISVPDVTSALASMWDPGDGEADTTLSESHATSMNLVLHFGLNTTPKEALEQFEIAVKLAQRYPCRIIVLCPQAHRDEKELMRAKLFSQCYLGPSFREMCCCEAVIVGYNTQESSFLEDQVSLWIESDLPVYYWLHRVPADAIQTNYMSFLRRCRRIVYDYNVDGSNYRNIQWARPSRIKELSLARTLAPRQSIGQFLSAQPPAVLADGLLSVTTRYDEGFLGEAGNICCWQEYCLLQCRKRAGMDGRGDTKFIVERVETGSPYSLEIEWTYRDGSKFFNWIMRAGSGTGHIDYNFGNGRKTTPIQVKLLPTDKALSEALFFNNWDS